MKTKKITLLEITETNNIDTEIEDVSGKKNKVTKKEVKPQVLIKDNPYFITNKIDNYYVDDNNFVWNNKFQIIGIYFNSKIQLFSELQKLNKNILDKMDKFILSVK